MFALVVLDQGGVDRRREGRVVDLDREIFGARVLGRLAPGRAEFDAVGADPVVGRAFAVLGCGSNGRFDVDVESANRADEDAVVAALEGADLSHVVSPDCARSGPMRPRGDQEAAGRPTAPAGPKRERRTAVAELVASRGMRRSRRGRRSAKPLQAQAVPTPDEPEQRPSGGFPARSAGTTNHHCAFRSAARPVCLYHPRARGLSRSTDPRQCTYQPHIRSPPKRSNQYPAFGGKAQEGVSRLDDGIVPRPRNGRPPRSAGLIRPRRNSVSLSCAHGGAFDDDAGSGILPERHQQLARQCGNHCLLHPAAVAFDAIAEPLGEVGTRLMAYPEPGELDQRAAQSAVARLAAFRPDVVIDSFAPFSCLAARIENIPLVQITQGNFLADSPGFLWWIGDRPPGLPSAIDAVNAVAAEHGLGPVRRAADILDGDRTFVIGSPDTDPVNRGSSATHVGSLSAGHVDARLPEWLDGLGQGRKLIWVYTGNPRYGGATVATPFDSEVILQSALCALGGGDVDVVLTTGYQAVPEGVTFPSNIYFADFVSGPAMAARCDLMVHHGGHGSMITGLVAGKPAVIIPTNSERESNARRLALLGACEVVQPIDSTATNKRVETAVLSSAVERVLADCSYTRAAQELGGGLVKLGGVTEIVKATEQILSASA